MLVINWWIFFFGRREWLGWCRHSAGRTRASDRHSRGNGLDSPMWGSMVGGRWSTSRRIIHRSINTFLIESSRYKNLLCNSMKEQKILICWHLPQGRIIIANHYCLFLCRSWTCVLDHFRYIWAQWRERVAPWIHDKIKLYHQRLTTHRQRALV